MIERIMKGMAVKLATDAMTKAAENEHEDRILLVKHPGKKGQEYLETHVELEFDDENRAVIPLYVSRIIEAAAHEAGVPYMRMIDLAVAFHKIVKEEFDEDNSITKEVKEIKK